MKPVPRFNGAELTTMNYRSKLLGIRAIVMRRIPMCHRRMFLLEGRFRNRLDSRLRHAGMTVFEKEIASCKESDPQGFDTPRHIRAESPE